MTRVTEGIDTASVTAWLADHIDGVHPPFTFELISGGRSNLTFAVTDAAGRRLVLRRPPMSHVLPTAHDMGREYRIISALRPTPVPVANALGYCDDESVNERPFYVMDFVDGFILRGAADGEAALDERTRRVAGEDLVDVLAAIHHVDVDAVGLGDLARRDGYIERQLRRWHGQFQQSQQQAREIGVYRPVPLVDEVHQLLAERVPPQHGTAIVHGDYRIDNTVISAEGRVQAVLDWELCTLGDALADVGTLLAYWSDHAVAEMAGPPAGAMQAAATALGATEPGATEPGATEPGATGQLAATALPGFPSRAEVADRYAARSGRDLTQLGFYVAFAYWKLACILEGVFVRYAAHAMSDDRSAADALAPGVEDRARRALEALQGSPADQA
jgi:aminoglycoside phosphotransferase (APT) family kinase protein